MAADRRRRGGAGRSGGPSGGRSGRRGPRPAPAKGRSYVGERLTVEVGPIAHGGHCVARVTVPGEERARVVFVRHALPGERVVIAVTEGAEGDRFWRADAVEVLDASPDRVAAPCPVSGPAGCGGCDFQHVRIGAQRGLKATVVAEQLRRLAGIEWPVEVMPVAGDLPQQAAGLRWRTRMRYVAAPLGSESGARGMRRHRSHDVVAVTDCLIAHPDAREPGPGVVTESVQASVQASSGASEGASVEAVERVYAFSVAADGFWQVHPGAPRALVSAVVEHLAPQPGESALDLYGGVGLFARFLADRLGEDGSVVSVEGDRRASALAADNLADAPGHVRVECGDVARVLGDLADDRAVGPRSDLVVLDPPREGAGRDVVEAVVRRAPRAVAYVACDPAALARDVSYFAAHGYRLKELDAFDLFPMTHHVECVALLVPTGDER